MANVSAKSGPNGARGGAKEGEGVAIPLIALSALLDGRAICTLLVSIVKQERR